MTDSTRATCRPSPARTRRSDLLDPLRLGFGVRDRRQGHEVFGDRLPVGGGERVRAVLDDRIHAPPDHIAVGQHRSEEHTSELQSLMRISYAVFCLKKKKTPN